MSADQEDADGRDPGDEPEPDEESRDRTAAERRCGIVLDPDED